METKLCYDDLVKCAELVREAIHACGMLENHRSMLEGGVSLLSHAPKFRNPGYDRLSDNVDKLIELESVYREKLNACLEKMRMIEAAIESLDSPKQRMIMRMRFLEGKTWPEISMRIDHKERWCKELLYRALVRLGLILPKQNVQQSIVMHAHCG